MRSLATWCFRHRRIVLSLWLAALVCTTLLSSAVGTNYTNSFSLPHTESTRAISILESVSPKLSGDIDRIVFQTSGGVHVTDLAVEQRITAMLATVATLPHV